jgi:hypothetical protein
VAVLSAVASLVAGCSGNVITSSDASTSSTRAFLSVERTEVLNAAGDATQGVRAHASAYFMRLQSGADQQGASRLVGEAPTLPPDGQCETVQVLGDQGIALASLGPVDLVDVGEVVVQAAQTRATLATRAFPNVVDLISGVVYTTRDRAADPLPDRGDYAFHISGSPVFAEMRLEARAPGGVQGLTVAGLPLRAEPAILPRADLAIAWQPQGPGDLVYAELASAEDGPLERVRCALGTSGRATVAAVFLPRATSQNLAVHLVHRESVTAPGLEAGEVRFDLTTTAAVRFEAARP